MKPSKPILMATIGAAHGIRGEVRLHAHCDDAAALESYGPLTGGDGRVFAIARLRAQPKALVAKFEGIDDRNAAEALRGVELFVDRSRLPAEALDDDEFYHVDLEGLKIVDEAGTLIGTVTGACNFGAGDLLDVDLTDGKSAFIPFSEAAVLDIDAEAGRMTVDPVAAGLADAPDPDADGGEGGTPKPETASR